MVSVNEEIYSTLANLTKGLGFADFGKLNPYIWGIEAQGELTTEKLVLSNKVWGRHSLRLIDINSLNKPDWQNVIEVIKTHLQEIEVYQAYFPDEGFYIFIGKTSDNEWFGISSSFLYELKGSGLHYMGRTSNQFLIEEITPHSQSALKLIEFLETSVYIDILQEYDSQKFTWHVTETREEILEKVLASVGFLITQEFDGIQSLATNFSPTLRDIEEYINNYCDIPSSYYDEDTGIEYEIDKGTREQYPLPEYPIDKDFRNLDHWLELFLNDLVVYAIGANSNGEFDIYVLGYTQEGDLAGVLIDVKLNP